MSLVVIYFWVGTFESRKVNIHQAADRLEVYFVYSSNVEGISLGAPPNVYWCCLLFY